MSTIHLDFCDLSLKRSRHPGKVLSPVSIDRSLSAAWQIRTFYKPLYATRKYTPSATELLNSAPVLCCRKKCKPGTSPGLVQQRYSELINKKQTIVWQLFWCMCLFAGLPPLSDNAGERLFSWNGPPPPSPSWSNSAGPRRDLRGTWHNLLSRRLIFQKMTTNSIEWTANIINCNHDHAEIVCSLIPFIHLNWCKTEL